jgi:hypothetical protein
MAYHTERRRRRVDDGSLSQQSSGLSESAGSEVEEIVE